MYNLYNGNKDGKRFGTSVSTYNRERFKCQEPRLPPQLEEKLNKKLAEKPKPKVNVPQVGTGRRVRTQEEEDQWTSYRFQGKKSEADIKAEMAADPEWARPIPAPKGPLLDDKEKERFARLREFNGKLPETKPRAPLPPPPKELTELEVLEEMFARVSAEIEEREGFLADMREAGRAKAYEGQMKSEISVRVKQLKLLDARIHEAEAKKHAPPSSSASP